jgi:hypothetical protein
MPRTRVTPRTDARPRAVAARLRRESCRAVAILLLPIIFLCLPLAAGYRWNAIGPDYVVVPPPPGLAAYDGRRPALPISIEAYGTSVVMIPFRAHLRAAVQNGDLPLWNPDAGIGQPLAAQGEGGPYSPMAVVRALLPWDWANGFTIGLFLLSALAMTGLLRLLGVSAQAAALGGAAWMLSGALVLHIPRDNLADQLAMIPPLFLAATWAIGSGRIGAYIVFAVVAGLHALAGFMQIGVNALLLLSAYIVVLAYLQAETRQARLVTAGTGFLFLAIGGALASPYLLPIVEALGAAHNKNAPFLALIPMPTANLISFFLPPLFGPPLRGWLQGSYPDVADWNNLFAYGSAGLALLTVFGLASLGRQRRDQRILFLFFLGSTIFFLARYISLPPIGFINVVPILSQQSPKHTHGVAVFCLVAAAAFGADWLRRADGRRVLWITLGLLAALVSTVLTIVGRRGANLEIQADTAILSIGETVLLLLVVAAGLWCARAAHTDADAALIAGAAVLGELSVSLPLGNGEPAVVGARIGICALMILVSLLVVRHRWLPAGLSGVLALAAYAGVVILPSTGLPGPLDTDTPPPYMTWLQAQTRASVVDAGGARVFGIQPDYAAVAGLQDIEAIGPLATNEYLSFVEAISTPEIANVVSTGSTFSLIHPHQPRLLYDLEALYPRARPIMDWFGVRYLVLDHRIFGTPDVAMPDSLLTALPDLTTAYEDEQVTILLSGRATSKAVLALVAQPAASADEALAPMGADPAAIDGAVSVEAPPEALRSIASSALGTNGPAQLPVPLTSYRPNEVRASLDAPAPGVFVVKDSYFPGWTATLDGQPAEIVRVDGMVRGVIVPAPGRHEVTMQYRPVSFTAGLVVAALAALALTMLALVARSRRRRLRAPAHRPAGHEVGGYAASGARS